MIYRKQTGFDAFRCIAGQCPQSCCEGWQIVIDPESLEKYRNHTGQFADRLQSGIDYRESAFRQHSMRCSMLSSSGLCDLQSALGESYLCETCRQYPRHLEDFPDLREYSLSLSCPEVVRMMTAEDFHFDVTESEDEFFDDPDDFEDCDPILLDKLIYAREKMFSAARDTDLPLHERLDSIACTACQLQRLYDEGDVFAMDDICDAGSTEMPLDTAAGCRFTYDYFMQSLAWLQDLEVLESSWTDTVRAARLFWQNRTAASPEWQKAICPETSLSQVCENLLLCLLFTYVCGSIYDGQIYARTMIAVMSVRWIMLLHSARPDRSLNETVYLFSREVEHSDLNINALISCFEAEL